MNASYQPWQRGLHTIACIWRSKTYLVVLPQEKIDISYFRRVNLYRGWKLLFVYAKHASCIKIEKIILLYYIYYICMIILRFTCWKFKFKFQVLLWILLIYVCYLNRWSRSDFCTNIIMILANKGNKLN